MRNIVYFAAPTRYLFEWCSGKTPRSEDKIRKKIRTVILEFWIKSWLIYSIIANVMLNMIPNPDPSARAWMILFFILVSASRINEIIYTFTRDTVGRLRGERINLVGAKRADRIVYLGLSYVEVSLQFSIIIFMTQILYKIYGKQAFEGINSAWDATYLSIMTITTTGYGDVHPCNNFAKMISMCEALSGFLLLGLALAVYLSTETEESCSKSNKQKDT